MQIQEKVKIISSLTQVDELKVKQILMLNMLMQKNIDDRLYADIKALIGANEDVPIENTYMQDESEWSGCIDSAESMRPVTDEDKDEDDADAEMYCILGEVTTG